MQASSGSVFCLLQLKLEGSLFAALGEVQVLGWICTHSQTLAKELEQGDIVRVSFLLLLLALRS